MTINLNKMVKGYLECMVWADFDDEMTLSEPSAELLAAARVDCATFLVSCATLIDEIAEHAPDYSDERFGHDFWLTRNGHGAGYWAREELDIPLNRANFGPGNLRDGLTEAAKAAGSRDLYVGDDGLVYQA